MLCCWCCASDPIIASISVDRQGYVPGEAIIFNSEIDNKSSREMSGSQAKLIMVSLVITDQFDNRKFYRSR